MYEKIIKRDDGSKVKIRIGINQTSWGSMEVEWKFQTLVCLPRKRTWVNPVTEPKEKK